MNTAASFKVLRSKILDSTALVLHCIVVYSKILQLNIELRCFFVHSLVKHITLVWANRISVNHSIILNIIIIDYLEPGLLLYLTLPLVLSTDWKSHIFLMKNKLISDLTSQTKAGRGMAGAPGAAVTQRGPQCGPHQPHREVPGTTPATQRGMERHSTATMG